MPRAGRANQFRTTAWRHQHAAHAARRAVGDAPSKSRHTAAAGASIRPLGRGSPGVARRVHGREGPSVALGASPACGGPWPGLGRKITGGLPKSNTALLPFQPDTMTPAQLAAVSYLARYAVHTHTIYAYQLSQWFSWCESNALDPLLGIQRVHIELYIRHWASADTPARWAAKGRAFPMASRTRNRTRAELTLSEVH